jgi:hypothetical protein
MPSLRVFIFGEQTKENDENVGSLFFNRLQNFIIGNRAELGGTKSGCFVPPNDGQAAMTAKSNAQNHAARSRTGRRIKKTVLTDNYK